MMDNQYYIAVDVGGTQMRAAAFAVSQVLADEALGKPPKPVSIQKHRTRQSGKMARQVLVEVIRSVWPAEGRVAAIAVASPGPFDINTGIVIKAPNIPEWVHFPLVEILQDEFAVPVGLDNDANLAALGEWRFGAGRGHHHLVYLTISTGIGGGVIIDDRLLRGSRGLGTELGHITVMMDGPLCGCGQRGHLEAVASGTAIGREAREALKRGEPSQLAGKTAPSGKDISEAAANGDPLALRLLADAGRAVGVALADFLHIFNPTALVLGGGVTFSGEPFLGPLRKALQEHAFSADYLENLAISTAQLGDDAGLLGSLVLAQEIAERNRA